MRRWTAGLTAAVLALCLCTGARVAGNCPACGSWYCTQHTQACGGHRGHGHHHGWC